MRIHAAVSEDSRAVVERPLRLGALVVYEDFPTGLRARQTLERLAHRLQADAESRLNLWRFDLLEEASLRAQAAQEAADADLVVVSAHGRENLPATVNLWMEEWLCRKGNERCALVLSLDSGAQRTPAATQTVAGLEALAQLANVDVFLDFNLATTDWESAFEEIHDRAETTTRLMDGILHEFERQSFRHWGINE